MTKYTPHPIADMFPMLSKDQLAELAADIKANGLLNPIVVQDTTIIDGRNRYAACKKAKVTPTFVEYEGDDIEAFVVSVNIHRRHLSKGQQAILLAGIYMNPETGRVRQKAAESAVSPAARTIREAAKILHESPERAQLVLSGKLSYTVALTEVNTLIRDRDGSEKRRAKMVKMAEKLAAELEDYEFPEMPAPDLGALTVEDVNDDTVDNSKGEAAAAALGLELYEEVLAIAGRISKLADEVPDSVDYSDDAAYTTLTIKSLEGALNKLAGKVRPLTSTLYEQSKERSNLRAV